MFTETRRLIQKAEEDNSVINIHPLDMTELINELPDSPVDILYAGALVGPKKSYVVIGDKVYFQTTNVPRRPWGHYIQ
jgi:hypothetical protein